MRGFGWCHLKIRFTSEAKERARGKVFEKGDSCINKNEVRSAQGN